MSDKILFYKSVDEIRQEIAGYKQEGTPEFKKALLARRVDVCLEYRGEQTCVDCVAVDSCKLFKEYLEEVVYKIGDPKNHDRGTEKPRR